MNNYIWKVNSLTKITGGCMKYSLFFPFLSFSCFSYTEGFWVWVHHQTAPRAIPTGGMEVPDSEWPRSVQELQSWSLYSLNQSHRACVSHSAVSNSLWPPWTVTHQAPLSMEFSRQEYWSGLPFPSSEDLPDPGTGPRFPPLQVFAVCTTREAQISASIP